SPAPGSAMTRRTHHLAELAVGLPLLLLALAGNSPGQPPLDKEAVFAERVAPALREHCLECHSPQRSRGGLDLSNRAALLDGGNDGPAIVPAESSKSLLLAMVRG